MKKSDLNQRLEFAVSNAGQNIQRLCVIFDDQHKQIGMFAQEY